LGSCFVALVSACVLSLLIALPARSEMLKEIASVQGARQNQLIGYGLIVGLDGTGDQTTQAPFTSQSMASMLQQLGITLPPGVTPQLRNSAAVMVTAQLPAYAQPGQTIDVTVSSIGNAKSLKGGTLILTPLRGVDGQVYAIAQGNVSAAAGRGAANQLSAGRVPAGATVERVVQNDTLARDTIQIELNQTDFSTVRRVVEAINRRAQETGAKNGTEKGPVEAPVPAPVARALDARVIQVRLPADPDERVGFLAELETLEISSAKPAAKVIVNARTGSVVMNQAVTLSECAVAHGNLVINVGGAPAGQAAPAAPAGAAQAATPAAAPGGGVMLVQAAPRLSEVVRVLNAMGVSAQDLVAILQALKAAGSLKAELEII
jgi:flagellar P-ring protein precursor FlgI